MQFVAALICPRKLGGKLTVYQIYNSWSKKVEDAVEQAFKICEAVEQLSRVTEQCILEELGIHVCNANTDSNETESWWRELQYCGEWWWLWGPVICDSNVALEDSDLISALPTNEHLLTMLQEKSYNWFVFVEELNMMIF